MKKAFYFSHDTNAIQDPKMMALLSKCGVAGVGLYWILIEILHQQQNATECDPIGGPLGGHWGGIGVSDFRNYIEFYGKQGAYNENILDTFEKVVFDVKLLKIENGFVYSERVKNNLKNQYVLSENGRENAKKRWGAIRGPLGTQCDPNAINKSKVNNIKTTTSSLADARFDAFWDIYPKKMGKGAAFKSWKKIRGIEVVFEKILGAVAAQKKSEQWLKEGGQFIPHPATWLNQMRWEDEIKIAERLVG